MYLFKKPVAFWFYHERAWAYADFCVARKGDAGNITEITQKNVPREVIFDAYARHADAVREAPFLGREGAQDFFAGFELVEKYMQGLLFGRYEEYNLRFRSIDEPLKTLEEIFG